MERHVLAESGTFQKPLTMNVVLRIEHPPNEFRQRISAVIAFEIGLQTSRAGEQHRADRLSIHLRLVNLGYELLITIDSRICFEKGTLR